MTEALDNISFPQIHSFETEDEVLRVLDIASAVVENSETKNNNNNRFSLHIYKQIITELDTQKRMEGERKQSNKEVHAQVKPPSVMQR